VSSRWRTYGATLAFFAYAAILVTTSRGIAHRFFDGWAARLLTMAGIALGMAPWVRWLGPRIVRVLEWLGYGLLVACYFSVLIPFVVISRLVSNPLRIHRSSRVQGWMARAPLPDTLDAARAEY
jgi:hypothetical protein